MYGRFCDAVHIDEFAMVGLVVIPRPKRGYFKSFAAKDDYPQIRCCAAPGLRRK
jgi:hypothetical protein